MNLFKHCSSLFIFSVCLLRVTHFLHRLLSVKHSMCFSFSFFMFLILKRLALNFRECLLIPAPWDLVDKAVFMLSSLLMILQALLRSLLNLCFSKLRDANHSHFCFFPLDHLSHSRASQSHCGSSITFLYPKGLEYLETRSASDPGLDKCSLC